MGVGLGCYRSKYVLQRCEFACLIRELLLRPKMFQAPEKSTPDHTGSDRSCVHSTPIQSREVCTAHRFSHACVHNTPIQSRVCAQHKTKHATIYSTSAHTSHRFSRACVHSTPKHTTSVTRASTIPTQFSHLPATKTIKQYPKLPLQYRRR